jgi:type IX secretion system PorP/SprF family membrane protein
MKFLKIVCLIWMVVLSKNVSGQLTTMGSMYYLNRYIQNPAMAGIEGGIELNAAYKAQWVGIADAPKVQMITGVYGQEDRKFGLGFAFFNETAGLIRKTQIKGSYAYHIPLNDGNSFLDLGLSAGVVDSKIDINKIKGSSNDVSVGQFNQRKAYFDSEFGLAFRSGVFTGQIALLSLRELFEKKRDEFTMFETPTLYSAIGVKIIDRDPLFLDIIEPMIAFRNVKGYKNIVDVGVKTESFDKRLLLSAIYHSTSSFTFGVGGNFGENFTLLGMYKTNTSAMSNYSSGEFEIGLQYKIRK